MPGYSSECQPLADKVKGLQSDVASFQKELQTAAPGAKSGLISQITKLQQQVTQQEGLLADCVKKHPYQPPPPPPKNPCLSIYHDLQQLQVQLEQVIQKALAPIQAELQKAAGGEKAGILQQIKETRANIMATNPLVKEIAAKQKDYNDCLLKHGGKLAIDANFKGKATMRTNNEHAKGPFTQNVTIGLRFSAWNNAHIAVTDFPGVSVTYDTHSPVGEVTTTVSMTTGSGTFDEKTRFVTFQLELYFEHSTSLAGPSSLNITLTGSKPMTSDGGIDVSGDSTFKGGYLGGNTCSIEVSGTISPHP